MQLLVVLVVLVIELSNAEFFLLEFEFLALAAWSNASPCFKTTEGVRLCGKVFDLIRKTHGVVVGDVTVWVGVFVFIAIAVVVVVLLVFVCLV